MSVRIVLRKFGKILVTIILALILSATVAVGVTRFFTIQTIEVQGPGIGLIVDQKKFPRNLLFFPTELVRSQLLSENPLLGDVEIRKKLPHTLVIAVKPRTPVARLQTNGRSVDVDKEGIVVSDSMPGTMLPLIFFDIESVRVGQKIHNPQVSLALSAITAFETLIPIDSITELDSQSLQVKSGTLYMYITQQAHMSDIAATLQTLLEGFRIKGTLPTVIDLRFIKPVISF